MALKIRRGTNAQRLALTGAQAPADGELLYVTNYQQEGVAPLWIGHQGVAGGVSTALVLDVNGQSGNVSLTTDDIPAGTDPDKQYFSQSYVDGVVETATSNLFLDGNEFNTGITFAYDADNHRITAEVNLVSGVSKVNEMTGDVVLTTTDIAEGDNQYFTEQRVYDVLENGLHPSFTYTYQPTTKVIDLYLKQEQTLQTINDLNTVRTSDSITFYLNGLIDQTQNPVVYNGRTVQLGDPTDAECAARLQINNNYNIGQSMLAFKQAFAGTDANQITFDRSRGTIASPEAVQYLPSGTPTGDRLGSIIARGYSGTTYRNAASITFAVDGAVTSSVVPGRIQFITQGTSGSAQTNFTVNSDGSVHAYKIGNLPLRGQDITVDVDGKWIFNTGSMQVNSNFISAGLESCSPNYMDVSSSTTYSFSTTKSQNILVVASGGLTATLNMPPSPVDGQICKFVVSGNSITLTVGSGAVVDGFSGVHVAGTSFKYVFRSADANWYRIG